MPTLRKPNHITLTADEIAKLAGVELSGAKVSRGADDGNVCTLTGADGSTLTFNREEMLKAIRLADGYVESVIDGAGKHVMGSAPETARLPMGSIEGRRDDGSTIGRHSDGWPISAIDAGIAFEADGTSLTISWLEDV